MSGNRELQAADVAPPFAYDADIPGPSGVYSRDLSTSNDRYVIPDAWKGNFVTFEATGDCQFAFGDSGVSVTMDQRSSSSSGTLTPDAATGFPLISGVPKHFRVPKHTKVTHFTVRASAASGGWFAYMSNNLITDDG